MFAFLFDTRLFLWQFFSPECSLCFIFITAVQQRQQNYTLWPVKWSVFFWKWMLNTQLYCWQYELNLSDRILFIWLWKWTPVKPAGITMLYYTWITLLDSVSLYLILSVSLPQCAHTHTHTLYVMHRKGRQAWIRSFRSVRLLTLK